MSAQSDSVTHTNWFKKQLNLLLIAVSFFTRIPIPKWVEFDSEKLNKASRYFGVVGLLVGLISAFVFWLSQFVLPNSVSIILAMMASVLATGGFHEDGLADTADGFGGGWKVADKLRIMKDSRIGTYGTLSVGLTLLLKWQLLVEIASYSPLSVVIALIAAHPLSRVVAASLIFSEQYVTEDDGSKSKPLAQHQHINDLLILCASGAVVLACLIGVFPFVVSLCLLLALVVTRQVLIWGFNRQIGGYTGDTLGAAQQISELVCYIIILSIGLSS
ncbi:adenosylcobinamide-GDP ribazoletransferase [Vibrio sp. UCD-FRSSP16_10]|uniref:adenosylcobinamide-GDP ribazoletransferase n=1 Tax=unclassified Vibrio TaxID=2614977 RepID=UPI000800B53A|nr:MULTISPECIES: adenosylcobinamide-GDP ribazoletransferase [unclassified Vibrio]OBT07874.1 adenosylcobinamide-GDP ribazoletransferase [Vibrio sp. UCD-FRSSP16_30]OBT17050.1 adenosylcobinamide-GDP ribazoletransferase [Vibrio sp. UCD-FRSSP16_10]